MPSLASAILEMRSSLAFCAISMSEAIYGSFCCGAARGLILGARHYKGCAIARTLTEVKIQAPRNPRGVSVELRFRGLLLRDCEQRSTAEARVHRCRPALRDLHRAVLELRDLADRVELGVGEHVRRRLVVAERDEYSARRSAVVGARVKGNLSAARFDGHDLACLHPEPVEVDRMERRDGLGLDVVEHRRAARHRTGVPMLELAAG